MIGSTETDEARREYLRAYYEAHKDTIKANRKVRPRTEAAKQA